MSFDYADEKLTEAVYILAAGTGSIQERLADAALILTRIRPDDVPEGELRRKLVGILDDVTFEEPRQVEGRIAASMKGTRVQTY